MANPSGNGNGMINRVEQYEKFGYRTVPIRADGSKAPAIAKWKPFQDPEHEPCDIKHFESECGIGVLCGACSGNLEALDFDEPGVFSQFAKAMEKFHPGIIKRCVIIDTPAGGNHAWYRCEEPVQSNQKLAYRNGSRKAAIETRGEGGYVLGPGSPNECHPTGNLYRRNPYGARISQVPTLTAEERECLLRIARTFDERPAQEERTDEYEDKGRPGDEFNREADWEPILEPYGWKKTGKQGSITYWLRPDKKTGVSATTGLKSKSGLDLFCVFTTSCPEFTGPDGASTCSIHTKFDTFCRLHHKGSHKAGAADLAEQGYGTKLEAERNHWFTFEELKEMDWDVHYLVEDVLAENHVCIMFGPSKTLKTTLASELSICLATGLPFLGKYNIPEPVNVGIMSGESGRATMRDTFMRIAESKGLDHVENFFFSPTLPKLSIEKKLVNIENDIIDMELKVLILDPAYLCMNVGERESSLFAVGAILNPFIEVCAAHEVTPIILHHTKQSIRPGRAAMLGDLSWAGFEQIARQWIGLNRMSDYEVGSGTHELVCTFGGSMGHSSQLDIRVEEGADHDQWAVELETLDASVMNALHKWLSEQDEPKTQKQIIHGMKNPQVSGSTFKKLIRKLDKCQRIMTHEKINNRGLSYEAYSAINSTSTSHADTED